MKRLTVVLAAMLLVVLLVACGSEPEQKVEVQTQEASVEAAQEAAPEQVPTPEVIDLTYANFPPPFTVPCVQMEHWKEEVEKRTNGQVKVATFPGGTVLKSKNMMRGVLEGQADIGCLSMSYQPGVFPLTTAVEMPVGFNSSVVASRVLWELFLKYDPTSFADVKVLAMFATPPTNIMSIEPVTTLDDLQGLELRAGGTPTKYLELLGAAPVSMPMPETPDALQKNLVKGLFSSLEVLQDMKFAEYCPNVTIMDGPVYVFAVIMNKDKWESLPADVQKVFDDMALEQVEWTGRYWDQHTSDAVAWSEKEYGLKVHELSTEDMNAIPERTAAIIDGWKESASKAEIPADAVIEDLMLMKPTFEAEYENQ